MLRFVCVALGIGVLASTAHATDTVTFKNGDRVSGSIVKMEGDKLIITTPYVEKMTVDWKEVATVQSDTPHIVRINPDNFVNAKMGKSADGIVLEADDLKSARTIRPEEVATIDIPPGARWEGVVAASVAGTEGNIKTFAMGGMAEAIRKTDDDRLRFGVSTDIREAQVDKNGRKKTVQTGQKHNAWINYDYNLDDHWSLGGYTRFEHDKFKDLNYRALIGGGPRYRFFDDKTKYLSAYLGLAYIYESYNERTQFDTNSFGLWVPKRNPPDKNRDFVSLALGDEFSMKITPTLSVYQHLDIYPNVEDFKDTLVHFDAGLRQKVMGGLFIGLGIGDDYDNVPAEGKKKNDFLYFGNVGYEF